MNRMAETCASVSKDPNQSQIFLEELERIQQKMSSTGERTTQEDEWRQHK